MGFSNNYTNASFDIFDSKPEGEYEVIIKEIKDKEFKTGTHGLNMKLLIRNDVNQHGKNGFFFHTFWKRKTPTTQDFQVDGYSFNQLMWLAQQCGLPSGKNYDSFEQFCNDMIDKCIRVKMEYDNDRIYNGRPQEKITAIMKTQHPECHHKYKPDLNIEPEYAAPRETAFATETSAAVDLIDEDLPF